MIIIVIINKLTEAQRKRKDNTNLFLMSCKSVVRAKIAIISLATVMSNCVCKDERGNR